jgi:hypothetical protein
MQRPKSGSEAEGAERKRSGSDGDDDDDDDEEEAGGAAAARSKGPMREILSAAKAGRQQTRERSATLQPHGTGARRSSEEQADLGPHRDKGSKRASWVQSHQVRMRGSDVMQKVQGMGEQRDNRRQSQGASFNSRRPASSVAAAQACCSPG